MIPMFADLFGTRHLGKVSAVGQSFTLFVCGIGPFVYGVCRDKTGTYSICILLTAILTWVISLSLLWVEVPSKDTTQVVKEVPYDV
jgi:cyanate permease